MALSRDGARQVSKFTAVNGQTYGEWVDPNGTGHGDSIYSYMHYDDNGPDNSEEFYSDGVNWQTFHANFSTGAYGAAGWQFLQQYPTLPSDSSDPANFSWTWDPNESDDTWRFAKWSMAYGNYDLDDNDWEGSASGVQQKTLTYTATDSDGATGTAQYVISLHDPYEWYPSGSAYEIAPEAIGSSEAVEAGVTLKVQFPPVAGSYDLGTGSAEKAGGAVLTTFAAAVPFAAEALGAWTIPVTSLLALGGYVAGTYAPDAPMQEADFTSQVGDFSQDVADQVNINQGNVSGVLLPSQPRFADTSLAQTIQSSNDISDWYAGMPTGTDSSGNPYPAGTWSVTAVAMQHFNRQMYTGYTFDAAGYTGTVPGHTNYPSYVDPHGIRTWTYTLVSSPPGH